MQLDHIVISVQNLKASTKFYSSFLGKPTVSKYDVSWKLGKTKLFLTFPYKKSPRMFNKHNIGLNHMAFHCKNTIELKDLCAKLEKAKIKHSGVTTDSYSNKAFVWFDDPDGLRLEFYVR